MLFPEVETSESAAFGRDVLGRLAADRMQSSEAMISPSSPTIMVIDDSPEILVDVAEVLESEGYRVVTAGDGQAGLRKVLDQRPDLVLVDMMMPRLSGFGVIERIREQGISVPIVMMSANENESQRSLAIVLGADEYLVKPFQILDMVAVVRRLCPPGYLEITDTVPEAEILRGIQETIPSVYRPQSIFDRKKQIP